MKQLAKKILFSVFDSWFKFRFRRLIEKIDKKKTVYIVDIDNTLSDTWPSLHKYVYRSEDQRYSSLSVFIGMRNYILQKITAGEKVIFISARSYFNYYSTNKWLLSCGITADQLVLVDSALDKLLYLKELLAHDIRVVYIDDLSYDHEYGEMKLYKELIADVRKLPLTYLGVHEIELINSVYGFNHQDLKEDITYH